MLTNLPLDSLIPIFEEEFEKWSGERLKKVEALPQSGSYRQYYRIVGDNLTAIGAYNIDQRENDAFISFSRHFISKGLNVPRIYSYRPQEGVYLEEDLGDITLLDILEKSENQSEKVSEYYPRILDQLIQFQVKGGVGLDYTLCYPRAEFDAQSMLWDLNYFKYNFLKLLRVPFDEQLLEDDFKTLTNYLLTATRGYFLFRDFQSRNIMLKGNKIYFIDYQGGRRGALQYDLASLLFEAKTNISFELREQLLEHYFHAFNKYENTGRKVFFGFFWGYALIRNLQAMGAYGFRGVHENKPLFVQSIPGSILNLEYIVERLDIKNKIPHLVKCFEHVIKLRKDLELDKTEKLTVSIYSFSYKKRLPIDLSGNGGGFLFDCRSLPNPGRLEEFRALTGMDNPVIDFLKQKIEVDTFLQSIFSIAEQATSNYVSRGFKNLMFGFGCTGGRHRSVYCAEQLKKHLSGKFDIEITLNHKEQEQGKYFI